MWLKAAPHEGPRNPPKWRTSGENHPKTHTNWTVERPVHNAVEPPGRRDRQIRWPAARPLRSIGVWTWGTARAISA